MTVVRLVSLPNNSNIVAEPCSSDQISERICEQIADVHVPQVVEQIIEVPKMAEQILDVLVPDMVEQLVKLPNTVSQDRIRQRTVEQIVDTSDPQVVEKLVVVFRVFSQDRIQQRTVEQTIPATSLTEMIVEVPVIQTQGRTQQGVNTHVQHVVNTVEVERPKIIKQIGQKTIIQEKINQVTKHVEVPLSQFIDKIVEIPVVAQRQISTVQTVQKRIEISQLQITDKVTDVPVVLVVPVPQVRVVKKTVEDPQFEIVEKTVENPETVPQMQGVAKTVQTPQLPLVVQAPLVQVMAKTVQIPQLLYIEKIAVIPEIRTVPGPQTSESLIVDSRELNHQDCEVLFHVNKQSPDIALGVHVDRDVLHASTTPKHTATQTMATTTEGRRRRER